MKESKIFYPLELEPRQEQLDMIKFTAESINRGKKFVLINAPTGTGKSYYVNMLINWYLNNVNKDAKFDITTNSKVLQEQYTNEFDFITSLKGRSNYWCDKFDTDCDKGLELCGALKRSCDVCPYKTQRDKWIENQVGLSNFHLFNTFCMYNEKVMMDKDTDARVLIIDEAHDFEAVFSDFITLKFSARMLKNCGFELTDVDKIDQRIAKINTVSRMVDFLENFFYDKLKEMSKDFEDQVSKTTNNKIKIELTNYKTQLDTQILKIKSFLDDYNSEAKVGEPNPKENWVLDISKNDKNTLGSGIELTLSPVWVYKYLPDSIWNKFDHVIFLSGTILDKEMFSFINGLNSKLTSFKSLDTPFLLKNRPIYYMKCGKMTYKEKEETFKIQKEFIKKIMEKYKDQKGIIHSTTYEFTKWIQDGIYNKRLIFHDSTNREEKLEEHINSKKSSVIVSPSMHTGVDLKHDLSRFQILLKIPFPNISSNKIKQRQKTKPEWYQWKTVVDFIQAVGRSVRSIDDYADTYVLDSSLSTLLMYNSHLIPRYISNAIKEIKIKI